MQLQCVIFVAKVVTMQLEFVHEGRVAAVRS